MPGMDFSNFKSPCFSWGWFLIHCDPETTYIDTHLCISRLLASISLCNFGENENIRWQNLSLKIFRDFMHLAGANELTAYHIGIHVSIFMRLVSFRPTTNVSRWLITRIQSPASATKSSSVTNLDKGQTFHLHSAVCYSRESLWQGQVYHPTPRSHTCIVSTMVVNVLVTHNMTVSPKVMWNMLDILTSKRKNFRII